MANAYFRTLVLAIVLAGIGGLLPSARGQTPQRIFNFDKPWRYDQSGAVPAASWMATNYDDSAWAQGSGVLGFPADESLDFAGITYGTMSTILNRYIPSSTVVQVQTYYFRTTFNFTGNPAGVTLVLTNILDDGAVIYLNGTEIGRFGMRPGAVAYSTLALSRPAGDEFSYRGADVLTLVPSTLIQGNNVLAVELHQLGLSSADAMFGMSLTAYSPTPITITTQPQSVQATAGDAVTFSVTTTGGPLNYQWQKDGVNIPGATSNSYTINPVNTTHTGTYRVRVFNTLSDLVSSNAVLTVFVDSEGPVIVSAAVPNNAALTDRFDIVFDEPPAASTVTTNNIRVVRGGTSGATASYVQVLGTAISARTVRLYVSTDNWTIGGDYYVIINGLTDTKGNQIAPNSVAPVLWPIRTEVAKISDQWSFYNSWFLDPTFPEIYRNTGPDAWFRTNFVEDPVFWSMGSGTFYHTASDPSIYLCAGELAVTPLAISPYPVLFRRNFTLPSNYGNSGYLTLRHVVDDGLVLYLNGEEIYRWNMPMPLGSPLDENLSALQSIPNTSLCVTSQPIHVTNLLPGKNWLAARVHPFNDAQQDVAFGLEFDAAYLQSSSIGITNGSADNLRLTITNPPEAAHSMKIIWPNSSPNLYYGYFLEGTSTQELNPTNTVWLSIGNGTNGALIPPSHPAHFFRLRKGPNSP